MALTAMLSKIPAKFRAMAAMLLTMADFARTEWAEPLAEKIPGNGGPVQQRAQVGTIISVIVIAVVSLVGVLILANIDNALPEVTNDQLNGTNTAILQGFDGAMQLIPVVLLILVASLLIGIVQRLRGR